MSAFRALLGKELAVLFGTPLAYLALAAFAGVSALLFFEPLRAYNQLLFAYASMTLGGFEAAPVPEAVNLWDAVLFPTLDGLGLALAVAVPLVSMRFFAEERARGTDDLLLTTNLTPNRIVAAKFGVCTVFVWLMLAVAFVYPAASVGGSGLGSEGLGSVLLGLALLGAALSALGLACSALTAHQGVAAVAAWALAFALWDFGWAAPVIGETLSQGLDALALRPRFGRLAEGFVGLADLAYFAGLFALGLAVARSSFDLRRVGS